MGDEDRSFRNGIKHVKLSSVRRGIQWEMAWHLDGHYPLANWKGLAESFRLPSPMIKSIEDRVCYTPEKSCTLLFFDECLIPNKMTLDQLVMQFAVIKNLACIHVLQTAFQNGDLKPSNITETNASVLQTGSLPPAIQCSVNENGDFKTKKIFITYSEDSQKLAKHINNWLRLQGCIVSLDYLESHLLQENRMGYYDQRFKEADFILILVSPQYARDIAEHGTSEHSRITLYIHSRMQGEYMKNNCTNKRFIPVILPGASSDQGPEWLMPRTICYKWPQYHKNIFNRIHNLPAPASDRLPQHTPIITKSRT